MEQQHRQDRERMMQRQQSTGPMTQRVAPSLFATTPAQKGSRNASGSSPVKMPNGSGAGCCGLSSKGMPEEEEEREGGPKAVLPKKASFFVASPNRENMAMELGMDFDAADLVIVIVNKYIGIMLSNSEIHASRLPLASKLLCGQSVSSVPLHEFLTRAVRLLNEIYDRHDSSRAGMKSTGILILILATIYVDRLLETRGDVLLHPQNLHRVLFAGIIVAIKITEDATPDLNLMSLIGGMDTRQTKECEARFCALMSFSFWVDLETSLQRQFDQFCQSVHHLRYIVPEFVPDS